MSGSRNLGSLALEVFSIVLGVLLALGVSEWQEEREKSELAETALNNVRLELQANKEIISRVHENNQATIATVLAAAEEEDVEEVEEVEEEARTLIPGVQVRATAWETLLSTGVSNYIEYEMLLALSETYSMQSVYRQTGMKLVDASMTMAALATINQTEIDNRSMQEQFMNYFNMLLLMEETLLGSYDNSLEQLR